jgi:hypothetical protein
MSDGVLLVSEGEEIMACICSDETGGPKINYWAPRSTALQEHEAHELAVFLCQLCHSVLLQAGVAPQLERRKARCDVRAELFSVAGDFTARGADPS